MAKFKCWDTLNVDPARVVEARSPLHAAEDFMAAESEFSDYVSVRDERGDLWVYEVAWVDHPRTWTERLSEGAVIRAQRLLSDSEAAEVSRG